MLNFKRAIVEGKLTTNYDASLSLSLSYFWTPYFVDNFSSKESDWNVPKCKIQQVGDVSC